MKKLALLLALLLVVVSGCSPGGGAVEARFPAQDDPEKAIAFNIGAAATQAPTPTQPNVTPLPVATPSPSAAPEPQPVDRATVFAAYAGILEANRGAMVLPEGGSQYFDIGAGKVEVRDVTGDETPELLFLTFFEDSLERLLIYTWDAAKAAAVEIFDDRVRSVAGGGNYSVFMMADGALYIYASEKDEAFEYGFWSVSDYLKSDPLARGDRFIGDPQRADLYCRMLLSEPDASVSYLLGGESVTKTEAEAWLEDFLPVSLASVLMDSESVKIQEGGRTVDIGLYSEKFGPWYNYVMYPYGEECLTWELAWVSLKGDRESE